VEKHVDSVAQSHKPGMISDVSARLATSPWYFSRPDGTEKGDSWARIHSLLPQKVANLIVAGRCHPATQLAASSTRVTVTAMAMGQAAGTAAALAVDRKQTPAEMDGARVRQTLLGQHAGPYQMSP
jgi:hypothetical protein